MHCLFCYRREPLLLVNKTPCPSPFVSLTKLSLPESTSSTLQKSCRYPVPQRAETQGRSEEYLGRWIRDRNFSRDRIVLVTKVTGPSGQMTWIVGGPKCLDAWNISRAIDNSYVPMFGETEYDPIRQFSSVRVEEQLDTLDRAVDAGKEYLHIAGKYGLQTVSLAITFVLRNPLAASAVLGATVLWLLQEVLKAFKVDLKSEIIVEINKIHARFPKPCPSSIVNAVQFLSY